MHKSGGHFRREMLTRIFHEAFLKGCGTMAYTQQYYLKFLFRDIGTEVTAMKELVEIMAKALVDYPDQVEVTEIAGRDTSVIELKAAKEDMGKIIGKKGHNAQAMRTILNAASRKLNKHVVLEILDR